MDSALLFYTLPCSAMLCSALCGPGSTWMNLLKGLLEVVGGVVAGLLLGCFLICFPGTDQV